MKLKPYKTAAVLLMAGLAANGGYDIYYRTQLSLAPRTVVQQVAVNEPVTYPDTKLDKSRMPTQEEYAIATKAQRDAFYAQLEGK